MFGIGPMELMAILIVALLVFGPKRIPELARTLGRGLAEFRRASSDLRQTLALDELQRDLRQDPTQKQTIHRPDDRPAQAGDDSENSEKAADKAEDSVSEESGSDSEVPQEPHPGELPLGDEHDYAHREIEGETEAVDEVASAALDAPSDNTKDTDAAETTPAQHANRPADSELGNVPVSGTKPTDPKRG